MIRKTLSALRSSFRQIRVAQSSGLDLAKMAQVRAIQKEIRDDNPDNIAWRGYKVYSQNDEDGIIACIFELVPGGSFMEIGVQDGVECNSHLLLLKGWKGAWVEADMSMCDKIGSALGVEHIPGLFRLYREFARPDNVGTLYQNVCSMCSVSNLSLFSLDIDGNDLQIVSALMASGARPLVICVEYNGMFPPPIVLSAENQGDQGWAYDDYFGASLQAFYDVLSACGYVLVTCNLVGANAFFVRKDMWTAPSFSPSEVFQPLRRYLASFPGGHKGTLKFLREAFCGFATT